MSLHWGGRGPGHKSRLGRAAGPRLPSGAIGVWYADDVDTTNGRRVIRNQVAAAAVSPNLVPAPRRMFNNTGFFSKSGVTVTDNASGNTGSTLAGSGNFSLNATGSPSYPAGTYTMVVDCERVGGSDQQFKMGWGTSTYLSAAKTATATRQRITHTATLPAGSYFAYFFKSPDGSTASSIKVYEVAIYPGSVDLEPGGSTLDGHIALGRYAFDTVPGISAGVVDLSAANALGVLQWDSDKAVSEYTIVWLTRAKEDDTFYDTIFSIPGATTLGLLTRDYGGATTPRILGSTFGGKPINRSPSQHLVITQPFSFAQGGWEMGASRCSASGDAAMFNNGVKATSGQTTGSPSSHSISSLLFGAYNTISSTSGTEFAGAVLYDRVLTDEEIRQAQDSIAARFSSLTIAPRPYYLAHEGDSLSAVDLFPTKAAQEFSVKAVAMNYAAGGSSFVHHNQRLPAIEAIPLGLRASEIAIFTIYAATNELGQVGVSVSQFIATYTTYLTAVRAAGYSLIGVGTLLPSTISGYNIKRNAANAIMATWPGAGICDFLFDFAADPIMGPDAAASDTTYYIDGIHATTAGQAILKDIYKAAVEAYLI